MNTEMHTLNSVMESDVTSLQIQKLSSNDCVDLEIKNSILQEKLHRAPLELESYEKQAAVYQKIFNIVVHKINNCPSKIVSKIKSSLEKEIC